MNGSPLARLTALVPGATPRDTRRTHADFAPSIAIPLARNSHEATRKPDAMHELLSSERRYAYDLALVCRIHLPLAQGKVPSPSTFDPLADPRTGPSPTSSFAYPSMTEDDVHIIFRNISDIASFSSRFVKDLEKVFNRPCDAGRNLEDEVGKLFLQIIPALKPLYETYLRTHEVALARLHELSLSPENWDYSTHIRSHLPSDSRTPDFASLLEKPKRRIPEYCSLLRSILDTSSVAQSDFPALTQACARMELVARNFNSHKKVYSLALYIPSISSGIDGLGNLEANKLGQLESRLYQYRVFMDGLAQDVKEWVVQTRYSLESLHRWGVTFGTVLGFVPPSTPCPSGYHAFTSLISSLLELCTKLEDDLQMTFIPLLDKLKALTENPKELLHEMHALEPRISSSSLVKLLRPDTSKNRGRYNSLRCKMLDQLPFFFNAMDRAIGLAVRVMIQGFLESVRNEWMGLFNSLLADGEQYGGTEETLRSWRVKWIVAQQMLLIWEEGHVSGGLAVQNMPPAPHETGLSEQLAEPPPVRDVPPVSPTRVRMRFSFPPSSRPSSRIRQSVTGDTSALLYTIRAFRPYSPPPHAPYRGHSFFELVDGDRFEVMEELDHPSAFADLPRCFVSKKDKDCLLKVQARNNGVGYEAGDVGWVLARFVSAD